MRSEEEVREAKRQIAWGLTGPEADVRSIQIAFMVSDLFSWILGEPADFDKVIATCRRSVGVKEATDGSPS